MPRTQRSALSARRRAIKRIYARLRRAMAHLGRGLISAQEGQIVDRELIVSGRDTPTLLNLVEVINTGNATRLVRQKRPDGTPFEVREFIPHDSSPPFGA